ncbi:MAG: slipin family protein [Alphaproteobacteria bacterium]
MEEIIPVLSEIGIFWIIIGIFLLVTILRGFFIILTEYERGVVYVLGRYITTYGPGLRIIVPLLFRVVKVDIRTLVHDVPSQDVISRDNVSVKVNAVIYYRVIDPNRAINKVEDYMAATSQLAQTTLRSVLGKHDLDEMLMERDKLNQDIQAILDVQTDAWGIKVSNVEIKHVDLDQSMIRAIAKQAEAERERRAKIISAEGEQQAAQKLADAGQILASQPNSMQLRYLSGLQEIAGNRTNTIIFPFPMEDLGKLVRGVTNANER